jgi:hypothetical protein
MAVNTTALSLHPKAHRYRFVDEERIPEEKAREEGSETGPT